MAGMRKALVVAVDTYDDTGLSTLLAPAADATALQEVLADPALGAFDVEVLHNESAATIAERLEEVTSELKPADFAILHFSCHGLKDDSNELYLAARNTKLNRLASTAIDAALIDRLMRRSRAQRIVLFLDCCYGGAFEKGVVARAGGSASVGEKFNQDALGAGRGRVVITASTAVEYAFEGQSLATASGTSPSVFSGALVEGLRSGAADLDEDGNVSLDELYEYLYDAVRQKSPHQTPSKWEYGMQGSVMISRAPRRRVRPGRLPQDLLELMTNGYASLRLGAAGELARLATGDDLPTAAAARTALLRLVDDDSKSVSEAASDALTAASLRLETSAHDFGDVEVGSPPRAVDVALHGPPLAEVAEVASAPQHVSAAVVDGTVRLRLDTTTPASIAGDVVVTGPAGTASLSVTGEVRLPSQVPHEVSAATAPVVQARTQTPGAALREAPPSTGSPTSSRLVDHRLREALGWSNTEQEDQTPGRAASTSADLRVQSATTKSKAVAAVIIGCVTVLVALAASMNDDDYDGVDLTDFSEPFTTSGPWGLHVTDTEGDTYCWVEVWRPDGEAAIGDSYDEESVRITEGGTFALRWYAGDEDTCVAEVQDTDGSRTTIDPPASAAE